MNEPAAGNKTSSPFEWLVRRAWPVRPFLWLLWLVAFALWTAALLTTFPAEFSHENLPPEVGFSLAKLLHVGVYAGLTATGLMLPLPRQWCWLPVGILSFHGFATEYLQTFIPLRYGCWQDVLIDHVGIACGLGVAWYCRHRWANLIESVHSSHDPKSQPSPAIRTRERMENLRETS